MAFLARMYELRIQKGLSYEDLAERTGLETAYLSQIEHGRQIPSRAALDTLARALHVPLCQLFYEQEPPQTPWLTPRPDVDELLENRPRPAWKAEAGFVGRIRTFCHGLSSRLR